MEEVIYVRETSDRVAVGYEVVVAGYRIDRVFADAEGARKLADEIYNKLAPLFV